jgi:hypothetical protein
MNFLFGLSKVRDHIASTDVGAEVQLMHRCFDSDEVDVGLGAVKLFERQPNSTDVPS